ncbi:hypothetical protein EVJ58_g2241 [Rhodofomes roseus]|uniref:Uncharacterized protein n=1 Tax=Rhodofomes roseus TaxID=34475 RepID=A0A4Y9YTJ4_9APHY|nr:hypothetical protein EVJ58_g2241 [Rhodofomes roseus]
MWAGGKMKWNEPLSVGEKVIATSTIASVEKKGFEKGTPMVFVKQKLEYRRKHAQHAAIEEERSHVYLTAPVDGVPGDPDYRFEYLPSATTLFRFSALTFNGHFIHLDREYAATEGYPERLVHGPLTALMLLDVFSMQFPDSMISSFGYRAVNPLIVNRKVAICGKKHTSNNTVQVWAEDVETKAIGMVGQINLHNSA